jgi:hypothetical protein
MAVMASSLDLNQLETSIVLLLIKTEEEVIYEDPFFELLDLDGFLLVPINRLAPKLGLEFTYHRSENKIVITKTLNQRRAEIFLDEAVYQIEGKPILLTEPPLRFEGDLYVSMQFLELFAEVETTWDFRYQELTILTDQPILEENKEENATEKKRDKRKKPLPQEGPSFSLGSIRYELSIEHRQEEGNTPELDGIMKLRIDGRAGDWSISAGGTTNYDFYNDSVDPDLTLLRAKYNEDGELIIIGNAQIDLEKTTAKKDLWGTLYMAPDHQPRKQVVAYIDLSGPADEGDEVHLYLNDHLYKSQQISSDGFYQFINVPLRIKHLNHIRIVIYKKNGELLEFTQEISASPRIVKMDTNEFLTATGFYKREDLDEWEGLMVGYRQRKSLNQDLSMELEIAMSSPFEGKEKENYLGADTGLAFRINKNIICTLDWIVGGNTDTRIKSGVESSLLYSIENGYFEALFFYLPACVAQGVKIQPGQGEKVIAVLEIKEDLILTTEGYLIDSTPEVLKWSLHGANLTLTKKFGKYQQNSLSGGIKKEWKTDTTEKGLWEADETSVTVKYALREKGIGANAKGEFISIDYALINENPHNLSMVNLQTELTSALSRSILIGVALNALNSWQDYHYTSLWLEGESDAKWSINDDTIIAGNFKINGVNLSSTGSPFKIEELKAGLSLQHFLSTRFTLFIDANRLFVQSFNNGNLSYLYTTAGLSLNYFWPDFNGRIVGKVGYRSPVATRKNPQWSYALSLQKYFYSNFLLKLEFERLFDALWDEKPEYLIRLSFSRALGFSKGKIMAVRYSEEDNTALIKGIVYIDENGNGQFDEWEKRLPGIIMSVEGRRATTNEQGEYTFNFLPPGIYQVDFNPKLLPADYTPVTSGQLIRLRENENFFLDFGVTLNGSISGQVFIDANMDGKFSSDEKPLAWVGIILDQDGQKTFTNQDGSFLFEGVPLGAHTIYIDPSSLPAHLQAAGEGEITFLITEEALDITDLLFPLSYTISN